jgi:uncharacterized protein
MERIRTDAKLTRDFAEAWDDTHLHLIIMPTEKCNFRCVYCYEDFSVGRMKPPVVRAVMAMLERRIPHLRSIEINWFGGEPTVALGAVREIMSHAQRLCRLHGVRLRAGMTTNGYLLSGPTYMDLVSHQITDFQISLDGPKRFHDTTRLQANSRGSYDQIMANLIAILATQAEGQILLRIHLTKQNKAMIPRFVEELKATFSHDRRFRFTIQPVENLGGGADLSDLVIASSDRRWGENSHPAEGDEDGMERKHDETYVCYAAKGNSFVIRSDGRVGKCTVALKHDHNAVGRLNDDGTFALDEARLNRWFGGWASRETSALACPAASIFP